ncbi:MAG: hypothetical protein K6T91_03905 [Firmicutes bacterium]|nr:hypothetical protein [Bacillota bacterium]
MDLRQKQFFAVIVMVMVAFGLIWFLRPPAELTELNRVIEKSDLLSVYSGDMVKRKFIEAYDRDDAIFHEIKSAMASVTRFGKP